MDKRTIISALDRLGRLAAAEGLTLEIAIYGGVAMMLLFDSRSVTKDIDAVCRPKADAVRLADKVAKELGLHDGWIEDGVRLFLSNEPASRAAMKPCLSLPPELGKNPGLRIVLPTPRYLIAMKARALRPRLPGVEGDWHDLETLLRHEKIRTTDEVDEIIEEYFPDYSLADKGPLATAQVAELIAKILSKK